MRRLAEALRVLPSSPIRWSYRDASTNVWAHSGGPSEEVSILLGILADLGLVEIKTDLVVRTRPGKRLAAQPASDALRSLGTLLMQGGYFADQARVLVELGHLNEDGALVCPLRHARTGAAQLLSLLSEWDSVVVYPRLIVPASLVQDLGVASSLLPVDADLPEWLKEKQRIGARAEMYSVMMLRSSSGDPTLIAWVARDSDALGYDIEDKRFAGLFFVEVKGSRSSTVVFNLTENEWRVARRSGSRYVLHYWGEIDLSRPPLVEFGILRAAGYPLVVPNLAAELANAGWSMVATNWRVEFIPVSDYKVGEVT